MIQESQFTVWLRITEVTQKDALSQSVFVRNVTKKTAREYVGQPSKVEAERPHGGKRETGMSILAHQWAELREWELSANRKRVHTEIVEQMCRGADVPWEATGNKKCGERCPRFWQRSASSTRVFALTSFVVTWNSLQPNESNQNTILGRTLYKLGKYLGT